MERSTIDKAAYREQPGWSSRIRMLIDSFRSAHFRVTGSHQCGHHPQSQSLPDCDRPCG